MRRTAFVSIIVMAWALPTLVASASDLARDSGVEEGITEPIVIGRCASGGAGMVNPAALYCESLGYQYLLREDESGQFGVCILPDRQQCKGWDFYSGKCGSQYSYCAVKGYEIRTMSDGMDPVAREYGVCFTAAGEKVGLVSDLTELSVRATTGMVYSEPETFEVKRDRGVATAALPSSFDWRSEDGKNWMTPVRDQGSCGSCWSFAAVAVAEGVYNIAENDHTFDLDLSEQYLVTDCFKGHSCCGGSKSSALDYIKASGIPDEACFPYGDGGCGASCVFSSALTRTSTPDSGNVLDTLRGFRDFFLNPEYSDLYYEYSRDLKYVLLTHPVLLAETGEILIHFAPAMKLLIGAEGGENVVIDSVWVSKVASYLENLKLEIDQRREDLGEARAFELGRHLDELIFQVSQSEGLNFEEAFNYSRYSRAPGSIVTLSPLRDGGLECECDCAYVVGTQGEVCSDRTCSDKCSDWQSRLWKIAEKYYVGSSASSIKQDLIQRGPLAVSMGIQDKFEGYWDGDIYRCKKTKVCLPPPDNRCTYTNHAVVIAGYNDSGSYWIVRNSWGSDFEDNGYFKVGYGECSIESSVYSIEVNRPPVADANGPYISAEGSTVTFDGCGSTDPDGDALQYRWDFDGDGVFDTGWSSSPTSTHSWADEWGGMAKLEVSDGRLTDDDWASVTISNAAPSVSATGDSIVEGGTAAVSATFTDPGVQDTHTATINWGDGSPVEAVVVSQGAGSGSLSATHVYADNGSFTVNVSVTDNDGDSGSGHTTVAVSNVTPVVSATGSTIPEGGVATVSATFTDPGVLDTHTAIVDWGDGSPAEAVAVNQGAGSGSLSASHMYGDNGNFTAVVTVTDDDGGVGSGSAMVTVQNIAPTMSLDTTGSIACAGGNVFVGRVGSPQTHQASADDCGSDDLLFSWNFGSETTYFNDGVSPDPLPSPWGLCPFQAADSAEVTFSVPGVHMIEVDITDDDGGICSASMPKIVTGGCSCSRSQGYWKHQFSLKGKHHLEEATLQSYLDLVDLASAVYSELVPASDLTEAHDVLWTKGKSKRDKAYRHALAAWLNVAHGCVEWSELLDTDNDDVGDTAALDVLGAIEAILLDENASHKDLVQAKDLAEAVNLHDAGNLECND